MEQTECCLGGIRLSGVLRPKQVASVGAQTKTRAWAFRLSSSCLASVSHACCKWLPPPAVPYHTPLRARLSTPNNDPVARNAQYITNKNLTKPHENATEAKKELPIFYKGEKIEKKYIPDVFCFGKIILELKAVGALADEHRRQILNYLRMTKCKLGLLINFGSYPRVTIERFAL